LGPNHYGDQRHESNEQKAVRLINDELQKLALTPARLSLRSDRDPAKLQIATRLRAETTMSLKWIAQQIGIGSWKYLSNLLSAPPSDSKQLTFEASNETSRVDAGS